MKRIMLVVVLALGTLVATAMPSKEELAKAQSIVNELMKNHITANKKGKESHEAVGDAAMSLAKDADGEAAKFALFRGAVTYYARGKAYDKAADAVEAIMAEISDVPPQTLNGILQKAATNATEKKAPRLVALKKAIAKRAKAAASLTELDAKLKNSPSDPSLKRMHAELVAATGDWEAALKEFIALGGAVGKIAEDEANGIAASAADFWWNYTPAALEAKDAIKEHASALYRKAMDYGELTGLKKNLAEKRIAEFTPVLASTDAAPKVEYKFNYKVEDGNAVLCRNGNDPCVSPKPVGALVVPDEIDGHKITRIDSVAFSDCDQMTSIVLPAYLEKLPTWISGWGVPGNMFAGCRALKHIGISKKNQKFTSVNGALYSKDKKSLIAYPKDRKEIKLCRETTSIDGDAFNSCAFEVAKLPEGIKWMGCFVFSCCRNLEVVEYPKSIECICHRAFAGCPKMKKVIFTADAPDTPARGTSWRENIFCESSGDIVVEVKKGTKGWNRKDSTDLPERWPLFGSDSRPIRYIQ